MKHKCVVEFNQMEYATLISAWAAVVSPEVIEDFPFSKFISSCVMAGVPTVLRLFQEVLNPNHET